MKVKICGQTSLDDCHLSVKSGADYLGVVLDVDWSSRSLDLNSALPIFKQYGDKCFLLTFDSAADEVFFKIVAQLDPCALQLTGHESPETASQIKKMTRKPVYKSIHLKALQEQDAADDDTDKIIARMNNYVRVGVDGFVLDTSTKNMFGGTGLQSDWNIAAEVVKRTDAPIFLAGGINPDNVAEAVAVPGIFGIDMASGVESVRGKKSAEKLSLLFERISAARVGR